MPDDDEGLEFSPDTAYNTAMNYADTGMAVACVPVWYQGREAVFTTGGVLTNLDKIMPWIVETPREDCLPRNDSILVAFAAINHARKEAARLGAEPLN